MKNLFLGLCIALMCYSLSYSQSDDIEQSFGNIVDIEQLRLMTKTELRILRNEVFARKGYVFRSKELATYFENKVWYKPMPGKEVVLTDNEQAFVDNIKIVEAEATKPIDFRCLNYYDKNIETIYPLTGEKIIKNRLPKGKGVSALRIAPKELKISLQRILYGGDVYALDCNDQSNYRLMITNYPKGNYHCYLIEGDVKKIHKLYGSFGIQDNREEYNFVLTKDSLVVTVEKWKNEEKESIKEEKFAITKVGVLKQ